MYRNAVSMMIIRRLRTSRKALYDIDDIQRTQS